MVKMNEEEMVTAINKNLIIYYKTGEIFLKITDYQKGYWAETPIKSAVEALRVIESLKWFIEKKAPDYLKYI
jgi:hypothetical protein